jgi:hypothetical protein
MEDISNDGVGKAEHYQAELQAQKVIDQHRSIMEGNRPSSKSARGGSY